jgi:hypothetical protein
MSRETLGDTLLVARLYLLRAWRRALDNPRTLALRVGLLVALWLYIVLGDAGRPPPKSNRRRSESCSGVPRPGPGFCSR